MFECLYKSWNFFKNKTSIKAFILTIITIILTYFSLDFILNSVNKVDLIPTTNIFLLLNLIINNLGLNLMIIGLLLIICLFLSNWTTYTIAKIHTKEKSKTNDIQKIVQITFIQLVILFTIFIISIFILKYLNIFTLIIGIFLLLFSICLLLLNQFTLLFMGLNPKYNINKNIFEAWAFIKKRFWLIMVYIIFLSLTLNIIYYIIDFSYYLFFNLNLTAIIILMGLYFLISMLYSGNALAIFINKYK